MDLDLEQLITQVQTSAASDAPLDQVSAAMGVKADLDDLSDNLIGHFVDLARAAGCSWSEIGAAMGVTKQAAQQRHTNERPRRDRPFRFARFTPRARASVREANDAAANLGHDEVGTEHLLLGLIAIPEGIAGKILLAAGVGREQVLARIERGGAPRARGRRRHIPFTPLAKATMEHTLGNAVRLGHNYIGTEHVLLALFDVPEGLACTILTDAGVTKAGVEADILQRLKSIA
jgi:hypothetical protein